MRYWPMETEHGWIVGVSVIDTDHDPTTFTRKGAEDFAERRNNTEGAEPELPEQSYVPRYVFDLAVGERDRARAALDEARQALESLRAAWNEHMKTCTQHAKVPTPEEIDAWRNAPSNTASAGQGGDCA